MSVMMRIKPGDEVTAVYNSLTDRPVLLLKVTRVGRKFIHGTTLWVDPDGVMKEGHETKVDTERSIIYPGLRHDLRAAEYKHRDEYRRWQSEKQGQRNDIEWELRNFIQDKLDEWEVDHPMPQRLELPAPEAEANG